ncbi:MAG: response regulator, partial [Clostridia bacterium]|nr:response regulator [Clostridia bacterium]
IIFLIAYLRVSIMSIPDLIVSTILFAGGVFATSVLVVMWRITDRIRIIERQDARLIAAEDSNAARSFLLTKMSHEIRSPLNAILGYTVLARRSGLTPETEHAYFDKIELAGQQVLTILNNAIDMSQVVEGEIELKAEPVEIETVIDKSCELLSRSIELRHIRFEKKYSIQHHKVVCDKTQLNRSLVNLLGASCTFAGDGGHVFLRVQEIRNTGHYRNDAWFEIHIRDNGMGIGEQIARDFFTPFEQGSTNTVMDQDTALDMAITKRIVDAKGGKIEARTEQGKGTEFIITLHFPIVEETEQTEEGQEDIQYDFRGKRLLIVEDGEINREIARELLQHAGFEVETAENGKIGFEMVAQSVPGYYSAVLMDIQMPEMDGYEATEAIRALPDEHLRNIPIIAMTANVFREDILAEKKVGMQDHIDKPIDVNKMLATIARVLEV